MLRTAWVLVLLTASSCDPVVVRSGAGEPLDSTAVDASVLDNAPLPDASPSDAPPADAPPADAPSMPPDGGPCPGFTYVDATGSYYKAMADKKGWLEAEADCERERGHLIVISSPVENGIVSAYLPVGRGAWIGFSDCETEGTFASITDEDAEYANWRSQPGEPNNAPPVGEDCVAHALGDKNEWMDLACQTKLPSICECDGKKPKPPLSCDN